MRSNKGARRKKTSARKALRRGKKGEKMGYQEIYARLKRLLGKITNQSPDQILASTPLDDSGLGFTVAGKRSLAKKINDEFHPEGVSLTGDQTAKAEIVRDLAVLIHEAQKSSKATKPRAGGK